MWSDVDRYFLRGVERINKELLHGSSQTILWEIKEVSIARWYCPGDWRRLAGCLSIVLFNMFPYILRSSLLS